MKQFSLGFIFDTKLEHVLLIHKNRPAWQAGKINGIGGKFEPGEDGITCIVRETKEESDLTTTADNWRYVARMKGPDWEIEVFYYMYDGPHVDASTNEDQPVEWFAVNQLPPNLMHNLRWLIPLCIDIETKKEINSATIIYNENNLT